MFNPTERVGPDIGREFFDCGMIRNVPREVKPNVWMKTWFRSAETAHRLERLLIGDELPGGSLTLGDPYLRPDDHILPNPGDGDCSSNAKFAWIGEHDQIVQFQTQS